MANIFPFRAFRYSPRAGDPAKLLTQPYDKITPEMQERYFSLSPYNLAHVIRPPRGPEMYARAARSFADWIASGILMQESSPALFAYFQRFESGGTTRVRKGLIALGAVEDYSEGTVYRHELTHPGPKRDRLELLRRTRAHFGQIFMLYDDPQRNVDCWLDLAAESPPATRVTDEYGAEHSLWPITNPNTIAVIQQLMVPHKLLIADGHHRYETALAFRNEHPNLPGAAMVMMTLVNMRSPGLVILPTHRVVANLAGFDAARVLREAGAFFTIEELPSLEALQDRLRQVAPGQIVIGGILKGDPRFFVFAAEAQGRLDVAVLHEVLLGRVLGLTEEAAGDARCLRYLRGFPEAARQIDEPAVQAVFFLNPVRIEQVAEVAFSEGVMPQKSTDFYPKLLSGMTIYRIED